VVARKTFFVLRKEPKDFYFSAAPTIQAMAGIYPWAPEPKVFCFFSSEKKILAYPIAIIPYVIEQTPNNSSVLTRKEPQDFRFPPCRALRHGRQRAAGTGIKFLAYPFEEEHLLLLLPIFP